MLELKTIAPKVDHPLLTLPEAQVPAAPSISREPSQRRMMIIALALLLVALALVLYRDRDFWFPDTEAEDQLEPAPVTASTSTPAQPATAITKSSAPDKAGDKKTLVAKAKPEIPAPVAAAAATPEPPMSANTTRTVLPPLEIEVVAGDTHSKVHPGANSVRVDLQPGTVPRPVTTPTAPPTTAAAITTNASERVSMSAGTAEVVGQPAKPGYPMLARQMKVQGSVILQAMIGRDGSIQDLHVVSGPPILATAAQEAVRQWRFKPHYQGSEAVETMANITVNFTIQTN